MPKKVELKICIDENGTINVKPSGTNGTECLDLMSFLDKIDGFTVLETVKNEDFKTKKVQINSLQQIQH